MSQLLWPSLKPIESHDKKSGVKDLRDKLNAKSSDPRIPSSSLKSLSLSNVKSPKPPATTGNKEECLQIAFALVLACVNINKRQKATVRIIKYRLNKVVIRIDWTKSVTILIFYSN